MYDCIPMAYGKIQTQTLTLGYHGCYDSDVFQTFMSNLVQDVEYVETNMLS
jgi:hypothetical protein